MTTSKAQGRIRPEAWLFDIGERVKHRKGGEYTIVRYCNLESDLMPYYAYCDATGFTWLRPAAEMEDGRFVSLGTAAAKADDVRGDVTDPMVDAGYAVVNKRVVNRIAVAAILEAALSHRGARDE